jgi:hypothetical protein
MTNRAISLFILCALALAAPRPTAADTVWVLMLDNSASMSTPTLYQGTAHVSDAPAQDPDRLAVIATLVFRADGVRRQADDPDLRQPPWPGKFTLVAKRSAQIRACSSARARSWVGRARGRRILEASTAKTGSCPPPTARRRRGGRRGADRRRGRARCSASIPAGPVR